MRHLVRHPASSAMASPVAILAVAAALCGCAKPPAVQPYGSVTSAGTTRTLSSREMAPVEDFLQQHEPVLGVLAAPAGAAPARAPVFRQPAAAPVPDIRQPGLTIR